MSLLSAAPDHNQPTTASIRLPGAFPWRASALMVVVFIGILLLCLLLPRISFAGNEQSSFELTATEKSFDRYFPTYLANGHFSTETSLRGSDATLAYIAGLMDYTADDVSRPAAIPSWTEIDYFDGNGWLNQSAVTPQTFRQYRQSLDMRRGTLSTHYVWGTGGHSSEISITTFVSQKRSHEGATSLRMTPSFSGEVQVRFTLRAWPIFPNRLALAKLTLPEIKQQIARAYHLPLPSENALLSQMLKPATPTAANRAAIWYPGAVQILDSGASEATRTLWVRGRAVNGIEFTEAAAIALPGNLVNARVAIERSQNLLVLNVTARVKKGETYAFTKFVTMARDKWGGPADGTVAVVVKARVAGFEARLKEQAASWNDLWKSDVLVEDLELQRAVHSDLFYLLQNSTVGDDTPMTACGFTGNYFHHVFWDNDSWDFPVLLLLHPERARSQIAFRYRTLAEARERAHQRGLKGAMFPWESDPFNGTDQTPFFAHENAQREIHVNGDVAIAQWQYFQATKDRVWLREYGYPVIRATADFWVSRVSYQEITDRYEILHVTSPDEAYNDVNNDSFTNAIARRNLEIATLAARELDEAPEAAWADVAHKLYLPYAESERRHLDFDPAVPHDKQTWMGSALVFLSYPQLDVPMSAETRRNDFDFALRSLQDLSPDSNAMLLAMISVEAAELGDAEAAGKWLQRQQGAFLKPPFNARSETALNNTTHILATSSGFLQNFLFGFSGLRITEQGLSPGYSPVLPPSWNTLRLRNVTFEGKRFDFVVRRDGPSSFLATRAARVPAQRRGQ